jgi:hypothetical protein
MKTLNFLKTVEKNHSLMMKNIILKLMQFLLSLIILASCTPPTLVQDTDAMLAHEGYQEYGIPQIFILKITNKGSDENYIDDCEIKINDDYWKDMNKTSYYDDFPQIFEYNLGSSIESIDSVRYKYRCNYQGRTFMGIRNKETYYPESGYLFYKKPD